MTVNAYLWGLVGKGGETRAFLVAGDILIHITRDSSATGAEGSPIMAANHRDAVRMALGMTSEAEHMEMTLGTYAYVIEIPDYEPAHLYSAQSLAGRPIAPRVRGLLDKMTVEGTAVEMDALP